MEKRSAKIAVSAFVVALLFGCNDPLRPVGLADLNDPDTVVRVRAIHWAGQESRDDAVGPLIEHLADDDASVRFYAIAALKRITGKDYGYDYKAGARDRAEAVKRWRAALAGGEVGPVDNGGQTGKLDDGDKK